MFRNPFIRLLIGWGIWSSNPRLWRSIYSENSPEKSTVVCFNMAWKIFSINPWLDLNIDWNLFFFLFLIHRDFGRTSSNWNIDVKKKFYFFFLKSIMVDLNIALKILSTNPHFDLNIDLKHFLINPRLQKFWKISISFHIDFKICCQILWNLRKL